MSNTTNPGKLDIAGANSCGSCCNGPDRQTAGGFSRRRFLQGIGAASVAMGGMTLLAAEPAVTPLDRTKGEPFPRGTALRVKPILVYDVPERRDRTSWRGYGGIHTHEAAREEAGRIEKELQGLKSEAEFPLEFDSVAVLDSQAKLPQVTGTDTDLFLLYAAGNCTQWPQDANAPMLMFVRHRSGPFYLGYEIAHWRFLRGSGDESALKEFDADDVVVDRYGEVLWRLRAMYGLKNAKGTKMLTIGGLSAYSREAQQEGPRVAKELWGYEFINITDEQFTNRLAGARADRQTVKEVEEQTAALLQLPNITLQTDRKFVFNSYMALHVCRQLLEENGCGNFGFSQCMGHNQIAMLDTPACLVLSLANDEGYTAYCHTDLSHTLPGVLLRWTASRPAFVCNSHFPYDGLFFVAHCQAPRRMNGADYEPATIMTHYESDYGAACKTHYAKDQVVTVVIPNLRCTKWQAFRGRIVAAPSYPACRSQMEIEIDGDWRRLLGEMEGFHTQIIYGDYTREIGYALKKLGGQIEWDCFSARPS